MDCGVQEPATVEGRARRRTGWVYRALGKIVLARVRLASRLQWWLSRSHISTVAEKHALMFLDGIELVVTDPDTYGMVLKEGNGPLGDRVLHPRVRTGRPRAYAAALDNEIHDQAYASESRDRPTAQ
ncbi:hypothetical protein K438DRAFT_1758804 [Mycena galopus ATCC 62051]|nr:hypothetical protein K438DRAFT_1758804 [Mycena galopus ATCC 62051]